MRLALPLFQLTEKKLFIGMSDSILYTWSELMLISHLRMRWQGNEEKLYEKGKTLRFSLSLLLLLQPTPEQITNLFSIAHNFFPPSHGSRHIRRSALLNINNNSRKIALIYLINFCQYKKLFIRFRKFLNLRVCLTNERAHLDDFPLYFYLLFPSMWFLSFSSLSLFRFHNFADFCSLCCVWGRLARVDMRK